MLFRFDPSKALILITTKIDTALNILEANNVTKNYAAHKALDDVSIAIPKQSIFGLLGPNGAGKTTLIRIINQIIMCDEGEVIINGEKLHPKHVSTIGYLPEERGLYKKMKVGEQLMYLAQLKGLSNAEARKRIKHWLEKLGLTEWSGKKVEDLSKGMAQKIQFIVTVLHKPKLLIFDEPFSGFDPINANLIKDEILKLRDNGATIIFSTHRMESVEELCEDIALINKSNKILDGKLDDIKRRFKSNTFEVGVDSDNPDVLNKELESRYELTRPSFRTIGDNLKVNVKLKNNQNPNDLLKLISQNSKVIHFKEVIPSANEIFINSVEND